MARVTRYPDYDALAAATASGDASVIAAVQAMRLAYRDRVAEAGTKVIIDFKSIYAQNGSPTPASGKVWKNQVSGGDCTQTNSGMVAVNNSAGKLIGLSMANNVTSRFTFGPAAKLSNAVTRAGWGIDVTINSAAAEGLRFLAGWAESNVGVRAAMLMLGADLSLSMSLGSGATSVVVPGPVTFGKRYFLFSEAAFAGTNSIRRVFSEGAQVGADAIFDGSAGMPQPTAEFGLGGAGGYYSTANANWTVHRSVVEDLTASNRTGAQLAALEFKRYQHRFDA